MPDSSSRLEVLVDVKNGRQGAAELRDVGKAGQQAGTGAEQGGKGFAGMAGGLVAAAGGAAVLRKGFGFMKGAADQAAGLAKETAGLTRTTGMDAKTSSAWVSIAKNRGIETATLTRSFTIFSKQLRSVEQGGKAATTAFKDLGVSADQLKGMKTEDALMATADAFQKLPAGADKAAIAQQLFGRQSQALLPLLNMGSEGLAEQMKTMDKYGLTLDEKGVKKGLELAKAQREMKAATDGLKVSIGNALMPVLVAVANALKPLVSAFSWGMQNIPGFSYAVVGVAAVLGGLMIAVVVAGAFGVLAGALGLTTGALLGLIGAALIAAAPFIAIAAAIALLVAGLVVAYNKVGWFRDGVNAAFNAVKSVVSTVVGFIVRNIKTIGPLALVPLLGPIGLVLLAFLKWKDQIAGVVSAVINAIKKIPEAAKEVAESVKSALSDVGGAVTSAPGKLLGKINPFAEGGVVPMGGRLALVGEAGPELLQLPGGARVTPLAAGTGAPVELGPGGLGGDIHVHLDVDGRELAHVVARETGLQKARR